MKIKVLIYLFFAFLLISCFSEENDNGSKTSYDKLETVQKKSSKYSSKIFWYWEDEFDEIEKEKLKKWLNLTIQAKEKVLGVFPFDIHLYLHRKEKSDEPVPWAHTDRSGQQSVHFHVNPTFGLNDFIDDWTAPHEISHLSLPFLGKSYSWFAEGFATFMQCQIMHEMGTMTEDEVKEKYKSKISNIKHEFNINKPFIEIVDSLKKKHNYPAMYWGSVNYFLQVDKELKKQKHAGLKYLIKDYQKCCRFNDRNIDELIFSLDSLIGQPLCNTLLEKYKYGDASNLFSE